MLVALLPGQILTLGPESHARTSPARPSYSPEDDHIEVGPKIHLLEERVKARISFLFCFLAKDWCSPEGSST